MRIFKESTLYLLGTGLGRGLPFLLLPVLTAQLSVDDYGKLSLATTIAGLLAIIVGMNPNLFVFANFFKYDRETFSIRLFNILLLAMLSCIPVLLFYTLFAEQINGYSITFWMFAILVIIGLNRAVAAMHLAVEQMKRKPIPYFIFYLSMASLMICVMFIFIVQDSFTWQTMLFSEAGILLFLNLIYLKRLVGNGYLTFKIDKMASSEFARFSVPLLGHACALWAISFFDRIVIAELVGIDSVGIYSVAHTVALGLSLVHESIHRAWQPIFFKKMQSDDVDDQQNIIRYTWIYYGMVIISAILYFLVAWFLVQFFLPPEYSSVLIFLPFLICGFALLGMYRFAAGYFYHYGDTKILTFITIGTSLLHVVITTVFVSMFGVIGAAYAMIMSYFTLLLLTMIIVTSLYSINWFGSMSWH